MEIAVKNQLLKYTAAVGTVFFLLAMSVVLYFSINKSIEITNVAQDMVGVSPAAETASERAGNKLLFSDEIGNTEYLCIPLPNKIDAEDIAIENHYMDAELVVSLSGVEENFYRESELSGNRRYITDGVFESSDQGVRLCFSMNGVYEYRTVLENNNLYISFLNPHELYDRIVVIDPACGGNDFGKITAESTDASADGASNELCEKEIALDVARKLKDILDLNGIKAYYTRMDDVNPSDEARVALANETRADLYIIIGVDSNSDESVYGVSAVYNDAYFIPGFGSIELADTLLRGVSVNVKDNALGLVKAPLTDYALRRATVPVSRINVGCISNKQEAILLAREDYRQRLAEGIFEGILNSYEAMEGH